MIKNTHQRLLALVAAACVFPSCGGSGGSSTSPSVVPTPVPAPAIFVASGSTGLPIAGVSVTSQGTTVQTDAEGKATLPASAAIGSALDIVNAPFLNRVTTFKSNGERIFLWPRTIGPGASESFTARIAYTATAAGTAEGSTPLRRLPPNTQTVLIYLPSEIRTDAFADALQTAIGRINEATQGTPTYQVVSTRPADSQVSFELSIDGTESACASLIAFFRATFVSASNTNEMIRGEINLCEARWSRDSGVLTHELGHSLGLFHSTRTADLMNARITGQTTFTGEERLIIALTKQRRGGNRFPDDDRNAQASALGAAESTILCGK